MHAHDARRVRQHFRVDDFLDAANLFVGHRRVVREVEAGLVGIDERALLLHVAAQHLAQRLVHQVRRRVVARRAGAADRVDLGLHDVAHLERALLQRAVMADHVGLDLQRIDAPRSARSRSRARPGRPPDRRIRRRTACGRAPRPRVAPACASFTDAPSTYSATIFGVVEDFASRSRGRWSSRPSIRGPPPILNLPAARA